MGICQSTSRKSKKAKITRIGNNTKKSVGTMTDLTKATSKSSTESKTDTNTQQQQKTKKLKKEENSEVIKHYQTEVGYFQVVENTEDPFSKNVMIVRKPKNSNGNFDQREESVRKNSDDMIQRSLNRYFRGRKVTLESISNLATSPLHANLCVKDNEDRRFKFKTAGPQGFRRRNESPDNLKLKSAVDMKCNEFPKKKKRLMECKRIKISEFVQRSKKDLEIESEKNELRNKPEYSFPPRPAEERLKSPKLEQEDFESSGDEEEEESSFESDSWRGERKYSIVKKYEENLRDISVDGLNLINLINKSMK